jgi:hypothetical protein
MNGKWMWVSAALLCTTIASSYAAISYHSQAESYRENYQALLQDLEGLTILIDMKIDYGNGTSVWYNDTRVPLESNLLTATQIVASVDYSTSELGVFVNRINGVGGDPGTYWIWSYLDPEKESWEMGPVGCSQWVLSNGDSVSWTYTSF